MGLLIASPLCREGWDRAAQLDREIAAEYWRRISPYGPSLASDELDHVLQSLVQVGRVVDAIQLGRSALHNKVPVSSSLLCHLLEALLAVPADQVASASRHHLGYEVVQILTELQQRVDVDVQRMVALELNYLSLLKGENRGEARTLQRQMSTSPSLYVQALCLAYRARNDDAASREPVTEEQQMKAQRAHELLHSFTSLPVANDSTVDESTFHAWCNDVRQLAESADRLDICDYQLGQLMMHAPSDADGSWPCLAVRRVIEAIGTESLASGLHYGVLNSRGIVCRAEGGAQERELAQKYRALADRVRFTHSFTAGVLDGITEAYEREGREWDEHDRWEDR